MMIEGKQIKRMEQRGTLENFRLVMGVEVVKNHQIRLLHSMSSRKQGKLRYKKNWGMVREMTPILIPRLG